MPRFSEIPRFILLDFLSSLRPKEDEERYGAALEIPGRHFVTSHVDHFYGIVAVVDKEGHTFTVEIPFKPYGDINTFYDGEYSIYLERHRSIETAATSSIVIPEETDLFILRRKGGVVHEYLTNLIESGPVGFKNSMNMWYFYNINKPKLYVGRLYHQGSDLYMLDYWGIDRYVINCLPEHNRTEKLKEFFRIAFDQIYNSIYNQARCVKTLIDPKEVNLEYILNICKIYNVELNRNYYMSLFKDRFNPVVRKKENRFRDLVANIINYLKRKGTYSSLFIIFKSLFNPTKNNLEIYERWHDYNLLNNALSAMENPPFDLEQHMVDFNYLQYYGTTVSGCTSGDYYKILTAKGIPVSLSNCYIYKSPTKTSKWIISHNLFTQAPIIQCFSIKLEQLTPSNIHIINENLLIIEFWEPTQGYALLAKPDVVHSQVAPVNYYGFKHNLNTLVPISETYKDSTYTVSSTTIPSTASCEFETVMPSGVDKLYVSGALLSPTLEKTHISAIHGDYIHEQYLSLNTWNIRHNLDSKAIVADFYTSQPSAHWIVTHALDTKDVIAQPIDINNNLIHFDKLNIYSDDIIKVTFDSPKIGTLRIKRSKDCVTLEPSSSWLVSHSTSAYVPLVQVFDQNYETIDFNKITVEPVSDMSSLSVSSLNMLPGGHIHTVKPDHIHTQYFNWNVWNIKHRLGTKRLIATPYETIEKTKFSLFHGFGNKNLVVQFFNDRGEWVEPNHLHVTDNTINVEFHNPFKGYVCIAKADYTFEALTPSASWHIEHDLDILNKYNLIMQIQSLGTQSRYVYLEAPMIIIPSYNNKNIFYTTPTSSFTWGSGYGQVIKGNFITYKSTPENVWYVEHYLDTRELLISTYTPQLTGSFSVIEHKPVKMASQIYNVYDGRMLSFESIEQTEDYRTTIRMDTPPMTGYILCQAEAEQVHVFPSFPTSASWNINHNSGERFCIIQTFNDSNKLIKPAKVSLLNDNTASISLSASTHGYAVYLKGDYIEDFQVISQNPLRINHNLNKKGVVIQLYDDLYDMIPLSGNVHVNIVDDNNLDIYFDTLPVTAAAVIKGVTPPVYAIKPDYIQHYSNDFFKIEFKHDFIGYTVARISDKAFMLVKATSADISFVDDYTVKVTWPNLTSGYLALARADAISSHMTRTSASDFYPLDENTFVVKFNENKTGIAVLKEVGQLTYSGNLMMTPHYKAEIDISCEPLTPPDILNEDYANVLYDQWEISRPVSKYAHYHILIGIETDFRGKETTLYKENDSTKANIYTKCVIDASVYPVSGGYVYSQGIPSDYWEIQHNLDTEDIVSQCYDVDRKLILPKSLVIVNKDKILIQFDKPVAGICFIIKAHDKFTFTKEASGNWAWLYTVDPPPSAGIVTDHYFYLDKEQILPYNIQVQEIGEVEEIWYVPTMGYAKMRKGDYLHVQNVPSYRWIIDHNLKYRGCIVKLYDSNSNEILPNEIILHKKRNRIEVDFSRELFKEPPSGFAVVTAVGGLYTAAGLIDAIANGGYVKIGKGTSPWDHDPVAYNDLQSPIEPVFKYSPLKSEDVFKYYLKAKSIGNRIGVSVTEFGLFSRDDDLIFYSYVKNGQLYKHKNFDFTLFYIIDK